MNYIGWIILGSAYLVSWILASRHIFRCIDDKYDDDSDSLMALFLGLWWPLSVPIVWSFFGTPNSENNPTQKALDFVVGRKRS